MEDTINYVDGMVQVCFTMGQEPLLFGDALWFTQAEYDAATPEQIQSMKQQRYDSWMTHINGTQ